MDHYTPLHSDTYVRIATSDTLFDCVDGKPYITAHLDFEALKRNTIQWKYLEGGGYSTNVPISSAEFRRHSPNDAAVCVNRHWKPSPDASQATQQLSGFTRIKWYTDGGYLVYLFVGEEFWKHYSFGELISHFRRENLLNTIPMAC